MDPELAPIESLTDFFQFSLAGGVLVAESRNRSPSTLVPPPSLPRSTHPCQPRLTEGLACDNHLVKSYIRELVMFSKL